MDIFLKELRDMHDHQIDGIEMDMLRCKKRALGDMIIDAIKKDETEGLRRLLSEYTNAVLELSEKEQGS